MEQCVAALQCVAVRCCVLQCCSVMQCVAVCCSVLQCVALWIISEILRLSLSFFKKQDLDIFPILVVLQKQ